MTAMSNARENVLVDHEFRGITSPAPSVWYVGLYTVSPTDAGGGTEVSGGSYARVAVNCNTTNWAGTQGAGTTAASSGTGGTTSNNVAITFPAPTANWGTIVAVGLFQTLTGDDMQYYGAVSPSKTVSSGAPAPQYAPGDLQFQIDN